MVNVNINNEKEMCEYCYQMCEKSNFDEVKLDTITKESKICKRNKIKRYAKKYVLEYLNIPEDEISLNLIYFFLSKGARKFLKKYNDIIVLMIDNKKIAKKSLLTDELSFEQLKDSVFKFCYDILCEMNWQNASVDVYCEDNGIDNLKFLKLGKKYLDKKILDSKENNNNLISLKKIEEAKKVLKIFLYQKPKSVLEFVSFYDISATYFYSLLEIVKAYDEDLYNLYINYVSSEEQLKEEAKVKNIINKKL